MLRHYFRNRSFIYVPIAAFEVQNLIESASNLGTVRHPAHVFHAIFLGITLALANSASQRLHRILLILLALLTATFIAIFSLRIE